MASSGYTITAISDIPQADNVANLLTGLRGKTLAEASRVRVYLTRETIEVLISVNIGGTEVLSAGPANISTVIGSLPSTQDDRLIEIFAAAGDEIIIAATNSAAAAAREARAIVQVMPVEALLSIPSVT